MAVLPVMHFYIFKTYGERKELYLEDSPELLASCTLLTDFLCEELECLEAWLRRSIPLKII